MKISRVDAGDITFDNGKKISFFHEPDCCEDNYADFSQLEDLALDTDFDENLIFEKVSDAGFRFGNEGKMFFVPCYSSQNGYYSTDLQITYDNEIVLGVECELVYF